MGRLVEQLARARHESAESASLGRVYQAQVDEIAEKLVGMQADGAAKITAMTQQLDKAEADMLRVTDELHRAQELGEAEVIAREQLQVRPPLTCPPQSRIVAPRGGSFFRGILSDVHSASSGKGSSESTRTQTMSGPCRFCWNERLKIYLCVGCYISINRNQIGTCDD